jgi:hypothetical protein
MPLHRTIGVAAIAALAGCQLVGCSSAPTNVGLALDGGFTASSSSGFSPLRPGGEMAIMFVELHNRSNTPITVNDVVPYGKRLGRGTVIDIPEIAMAPALSNANSVGAGGYFTLPPTSAAANGTCTVQLIQPMRGYRLPPGATTMVLELVRGVTPGSYQQSGVVVTYRQGSKVLHQSLPATINGTVKPNGPAPQWDSADRLCIRDARRLPVGSAS